MALITQKDKVIMINSTDIVISTYNTGESWFPKFNGIEILHVPTGIRVRSGDERGQHRNKQIAFDELTRQVELYYSSVKEEGKISITDNAKAILRIEQEKEALDKESAAIMVEQAVAITRALEKIKVLSKEQELIMNKRMELDRTMFALLRNALDL